MPPRALAFPRVGLIDGRSAVWPHPCVVRPLFRLRFGPRHSGVSSCVRPSGGRPVGLVDRRSATPPKCLHPIGEALPACHSIVPEATHALLRSLTGKGLPRTCPMSTADRAPRWGYFCPWPPGDTLTGAMSRPTWGHRIAPFGDGRRGLSPICAGRGSHPLGSYANGPAIVSHLRLSPRCGEAMGVSGICRFPRLDLQYRGAP